jgi:hypothetical protein
MLKGSGGAGVVSKELFAQKNFKMSLANAHALFGLEYHRILQIAAEVSMNTSCGKRQ